MLECHVNCSSNVIIGLALLFAGESVLSFVFIKLLRNMKYTEARGLPDKQKLSLFPILDRSF